MRDTALSRKGIRNGSLRSDKGGAVDVLRISGAYVAYVIGSGFATGQEIVQFFTVYGAWGIAGMAVCTVLFSTMGAMLLADGYRYAKGGVISGSEGVYEYYCGHSLGRVFELLMPIILFCTVVIMIAGAGAAVHEYYGLDYRVGCTAMTIILFISYMLGFHRIVNAIGFLAPVIIIFMIAVGVITIAESGQTSVSEMIEEWNGNAGAGEVIGEVIVGAEDGTSEEEIAEVASDIKDGEKAVAAKISISAALAPYKWLFSAFLYASYNTVSAVAFFRALGSSAASARTAGAGGAFGGIMLMTAALTMNLAIMTKGDAAEGLAIPTLYLARLISPAMGAAFSAVLLIEIFSTAAPMMWTVCSRFAADGTPRAAAAGLAFLAPAYLLSGVSFEKLIGYVYPCTGILGFIFMFCLAENQIMRICKKRAGRPLRARSIRLKNKKNRKVAPPRQMC